MPGSTIQRRSSFDAGAVHALSNTNAVRSTGGARDDSALVATRASRSTVSPHLRAQITAAQNNPVSLAQIKANPDGVGALLDNRSQQAHALASAPQQHVTPQQLRNSQQTVNTSMAAAVRNGKMDSTPVHNAKAELHRLQAPGSGATALDKATQRFKLEGLVIAERPGIKHSMLRGVMNLHETDATKRIGEVFDQQTMPGNTDTEKLAHKFTAMDSLYKEVLATPLDAQTRTHVQASYDSFKKEVDTTDKFLGKSLKRREQGFERAKVALATANALPATDPTRDAQIAVATSRKNDAENAKTAATTDKSNFSKIAANHILLDEHIAEVNAKASGMKAQAQTVGGSAPAQTVASWLHFGYVRNSAALSAAEKNFVEAGVRQGIPLGLAHKAVTDIVRPVVQKASEALGGRPLKKVPAALVYPDTPRVVTRNGVLHVNTDAERAAQNPTLAADKRRYEKKQDANKFGTLSGDSEGIWSFGGVGAIRKGLSFIPKPVKQLGGEMVSELSKQYLGLDALAVGSAIGGGVMATVQPLMQLNQRVDGRATHIPAERQEETVGAQTMAIGKELVADLKKGFKNMYDLTDDKVVRDWASKMGGACGGAVESAAMADIINTFNADPEHTGAAAKAGDIILTALSSGAMLHTFFANNQGEAEVAQGIKDEIIPENATFKRTRNAWNNMTKPGRDTLTHSTDEDTWRRTAENAFHVSRGAHQVLPGLAVDIASATIPPVAKGIVAGFKGEDLNPGGKKLQKARPTDLEAQVGPPGAETHPLESVVVHPSTGPQPNPSLAQGQGDVIEVDPAYR
jgi:hypothetical protein